MSGQKQKGEKDEASLSSVAADNINYKFKCAIKAINCMPAVPGTTGSRLSD